MWLSALHARPILHVQCQGRGTETRSRCWRNECMKEVIKTDSIYCTSIINCKRYILDDEREQRALVACRGW